MGIQEIIQDIEAIKKRNRRVAIDKAWEMSGTRRLFIASLIYIVATLWLLTLDDSLALLKALVPSVGYLLSTLSLPLIKRHWIYATYRRKSSRHP